MLIVRIANFVHSTSGGLRTALRELGQGYQAAGHQAVLITPGPRATEEETPYGRLITRPGPVVPGLGGYRVLLNRGAITKLLDRLRPDRIEVHDRSTLRWLGAWARRAEVPSMMVSHESLDGLLRLFGPGRSLGLRAADRLNARTVGAFDAVVCTTGWAEREFVRLGATPIRVPLGVDLARFTPANQDPSVRGRFARPDQVLLLHCGRMSAEKEPRLSLAALAELRSAGVDAILVVAGDGPLRVALEQEALDRQLPATFLGHVTDKALLNALLASADVGVAPGPIETFGLAALETLASGTPVVARSSSALPEVIGAAGVAADGTGSAYAAAIRELLDRPETARRGAARAQAERFPWSGAVDGFLAVHGRTRVPNGRAHDVDPAVA
ncbi:glycosyltransferase [Actinoplanes sp. HUAS TT8]|uniref:glycosyltransferase n=1 Tax=Actinoplanes sp. HUAS TT8 TaxID=3447453 RepID=UPI003F51DB6B